MAISVITCLKVFSTGMAKMILSCNRYWEWDKSNMKSLEGWLVTCGGRWEIGAGHSWSYGLWLRGPTYHVLLTPGLGAWCPLSKMCPAGFWVWKSWEIKQLKRWLTHHWKTRSKPHQTQARTSFRAYLVAERVTKYISLPLLHLQSCLVALFGVTQTLLGRSNSVFKGLLWRIC